MLAPVFSWTCASSLRSPISIPSLHAIGPDCPEARSARGAGAAHPITPGRLDQIASRLVPQMARGQFAVGYQVDYSARRVCSGFPGTGFVMPGKPRQRSIRSPSFPARSTDSELRYSSQVPQRWRAVTYSIGSRRVLLRPELRSSGSLNDAHKRNPAREREGAP